MIREIRKKVREKESQRVCETIGIRTHKICAYASRFSGCLQYFKEHACRLLQSRGMSRLVAITERYQAENFATEYFRATLSMAKDNKPKTTINSFCRSDERLRFRGHTSLLSRTRPFSTFSPSPSFLFFYLTYALYREKENFSEE